ncbi:hypothetical protein EYF80_003234 [Liparis tanakae]|uniref:Uncharacterized protein n=1 Tax=Liparis tanakae TaxID=230148 RepID=A0A4Z2J9J5_9TELE|nr:hypothetical protein EYF80_003234 [Liparis tanakae]
MSGRRGITTLYGSSLARGTMSHNTSSLVGEKLPLKPSCCLFSISSLRILISSSLLRCSSSCRSSACFLFSTSWLCCSSILRSSSCRRSRSCLISTTWCSCLAASISASSFTCASFMLRSTMSYCCFSISIRAFQRMAYSYSKEPAWANRGGCSRSL